MCCVIQDVALLRRKLAESARLDFTLACLGRHGPQGLDGIFHGLTTVRRQIFELRIERSEVLLLLRRQVFPSFHSPQDLLLALGRHGVEVLQPLLELLLFGWGKVAELRIVFERPPLLVKRLLSVLVEPLPRMMAFGWRLVRPRSLRLPLRLRLRTRLRALL